MSYKPSISHLELINNDGLYLNIGVVYADPNKSRAFFQIFSRDMMIAGESGRWSYYPACLDGEWGLIYHSFDVVGKPSKAFWSRYFGGRWNG